MCLEREREIEKGYVFVGDINLRHRQATSKIQPHFGTRLTLKRSRGSVNVNVASGNALIRSKIYNEASQIVWQWQTTSLRRK